MNCGPILDSEESKNIAVVHKTNQGYSGKDLWRLKQERPELFTGAPAQDSGKQPPPPGFVDVPALGPQWLYGRERDQYLNRDTKKYYVRNLDTNELCELGLGRDMTATITIHGDASATAKPGSAVSKHVIINDLHRAASAMKLEFDHHDKPAAMFAIYDAKSSGARAEAAAKSFHVRLLPRLAQHRGSWDNERLEAVLTSTIQQVAQEIGAAEAGLSLAVALLLGGRLVLAASGGCTCLLFGRDGGDGGMDDEDVCGEGPEVVTNCTILEDSHVGVLLAVDSVRRAPGMTGTRLRALVRGLVGAERPRAACISLLNEVRRSNVEPPLAAAAVHFGWADPEAPAHKKARLEASKLTKVRCRHILLRHTGAASQLDRGKPKPTRSASEAEEMLLRLLPELAMGGSAAFTTRCKKDSDCDTKLRGGELAGDLGWLDKDPAKNRKVPDTVVRVAFKLAIGQLSDIVASERGVHLLLRTA